MRHDTRARVTVTATGANLTDVEPKLAARADEALGRGRWHQHGPITMKPWTTYDGLGGDLTTSFYEATMDAIATDDEQVDGL